MFGLELLVGFDVGLDDDDFRPSPRTQIADEANANVNSQQNERLGIVLVLQILLAPTCAYDTTTPP
jgi:hypothetical protein